MSGHTRRAYRAPRIDFEVTAEHIANGIPKDSGHCMIADALADAVPGATFVSADLATIRYTDEAAGWRYIYLTPGPAQAALLAFDQGETPEPFRVKQNAAQMVLTGTARKQRSARNKEIKANGGTPPRESAALVPPRGGSGTSVPVKVGGKTIGEGVLSGTKAANEGAGNAARRGARRGKRREFGLRRFVK
jgi:hypothetical protein